MREAGRVFNAALLGAVARRKAGMGASGRGDDTLERDEEREQG